MGLIDKLTATAVSFVVGGNTGISPFVTLFLVGVIEKSNPDLLNMDGNMETLLSSWISLFVLGGLSSMELFSKCVPIFDEIVDSVMTLIVPVMSVLGTMSTFGLYDMNDQMAHVAHDNMYDYDYNNNDYDYGGDGGRRRLNIAVGAWRFFQFLLIVSCVFIALCLHFLKMLIRMLGQGWLTCCLAIVETIWVVATITVAVFLRPIALGIAVFLLIGCAYAMKRKFVDGDSFDSRANQQGQPMIASSSNPEDGKDGIGSGVAFGGGNYGAAAVTGLGDATNNSSIPMAEAKVISSLNDDDKLETDYVHVSEHGNFGTPDKDGYIKTGDV